MKISGARLSEADSYLLFWLLLSESCSGRRIKKGVTQGPALSSLAGSQNGEERLRHWLPVPLAPDAEGEVRQLRGTQGLEVRKG